MLLTIDCGNTNTVFALYDVDKNKSGVDKVFDSHTLPPLLGLWRSQTNAARTADEYLAFFSQHLELKKLDLSAISLAVISSVVPDANFALERFCTLGLGVPSKLVGKDILPGDLGLVIKIDKPQELGADRIVNALAVNQFYGAGAIVVDFGTATSFDVIADDGAFLGGVIAPGINLSLSALHAAAAKLPKISIARPPHAIGTNTVHAMQSGIFYGYIGLVEGLLTRLRLELNFTPKIIATGGLAPLYAPHIPLIDQCDEELTVKGLLSIYQTLKTM